MPKKETTEVATVEAKPPMLMGKMGVELGNIEEIWRFAKVVAASPFCPIVNKDGKTATQEDLACRVMAGMEIGLRPMQAIRGVMVVRNCPSVWGDVALALVRSSPMCESIHEHYTGTFPEDDYTAHFEAKRKGQDEPVKTSFSIADAKLANLWKKGIVWPQHPKRMLKYRARAFGLRDGFADLLQGVGVSDYSSIMADEVIQMQDVEVEDAPPAKRPQTMEDLKAKLEEEDAPEPFIPDVTCYPEEETEVYETADGTAPDGGLW